MELIVNENMRIINDDVYYCVQKRSVTTAEKAVKEENIGKERWENLTYHANLRDAVVSILDKGITLCADFKEIMSFMALVHKKIDELKK